MIQQYVLVSTRLHLGFTDLGRAGAVRPDASRMRATRVRTQRPSGWRMRGEIAVHRRAL